jgi:hypothetical protein
MSGVTTNYGLILPDPGEAYDLPIINANNTAIDTQIKARENQAKGQKYRADRTADSAASTDLVIDYIPPFDFKGGRKYDIIWDFSYRVSIVDTLMYFTVSTAAITEANLGTTGLTVISGRTKGAHIADAAMSMGVVIARFAPTVDVSHVIKFRMQRVLGTGQAVISANAGEPSTYVIIDQGAQ